MRAKPAIQRIPAPSALLLALGWAASAGADSPDTGASVEVVANPSVQANPARVVIDFSPGADEAQAPKLAPYPPATVAFGDLDDYILAAEPEPDSSRSRESLPEGLTQLGGMVFPEPMLRGARMVRDVSEALAPNPDPATGTVAEICAFPDEVPSGVYDQTPRPGRETPRFHTVYLNYVGGEMQRGGENSAENMSNIAASGTVYPVYGGGEERAIAVAQAVQADFEDWAVRVVYVERPPKILPYTMVMIGGSYTDTTAGPSGGVAPLDCEDNGQRNVCYAFQNLSPVATQANVASQEIGHTLGLGHTQASDSVMAFSYAFTEPGDLGFNDSCADTVNVQGQSASCIGVNKCHCGVGEQQHDRNTLFATFSPAGPDITPPTITLLEPADDAVFAPGEAVPVVFEPWDDVGGYGWKLVLTDLDTGEVLSDQVDYQRVLEFELVGLAEGRYEVKAVVQDHADQTAEFAVTITVGVESADGTDGGTGDPDGGSDGGVASTGDAGGDGGDGTGGQDAGIDGESDSQGGGVSEDGCGCTSGGEGPSLPPLGLFALVGLLGVRRRRR